MEILDISNLKKCSKMMDEIQFWKIIDTSFKNSSNEEEQESFLINTLSKLSPEEMIGFRLRTDKCLYDTYNAELWCAGYIMNEGCGDDGYEYFRNWIISRGKKVFENAKDDPDSLIEVVDEAAECYEFEGFWYVALEAFKNRTGKDLYDYIDYEKFKTCEGNYPPMKFNWTDEDEDSMMAICPSLYEGVWSKHLN